MISKWQCKNALTHYQRVLLEQAIIKGLSYREIAEYVGRPKSTVMREAKRLGKPNDYNANEAQADFENKQFNKRKKCVG